MNDLEIFVVRPTIEELRASISVLEFRPFAFFVQAWRIDPRHPLNASVSGALFFYPTLDEARELHGTPQCILGTRPDRPAQADILLATAPAGLIADWTARDLQQQELYITVPAVAPWLPTPQTFHLRRGTPVPEPPPVPQASTPNANTDSTP